MPFDKTFHVPDRYREGYEDETAVTFGAVEEEEISKDARKLARPWRRAKPPLAMPFHRTLERRDLFLHATAEALARANAAADAENRAVHAEHLRRVRRALAGGGDLPPGLGHTERARPVGAAGPGRGIASRPSARQTD